MGRRRGGECAEFGARVSSASPAVFTCPIAPFRERVSAADVWAPALAGGPLDASPADRVVRCFRRDAGGPAPRGADAAPCFQLAPDDAWRCPHCKQLQQGSITLSLWTLPDVLIVHLKRFRQVRGQSPGRSPAPCC